MDLYRVAGKDYDSIVLCVSNKLDKVITQQSYMKNGYTVKDVTSIFQIKMVGGKVSLYAVDTKAVDTLIIPGGWIEQILPNALEGVKCTRVIAAMDLEAKFCKHALYGCQNVQEFRSLSRTVEYDVDVFPDTVRRKEL